MFRRIPFLSGLFAFVSFISLVSGTVFFITKPKRPSTQDPETMRMVREKQSLEMEFNPQKLGELQARIDETRAKLPTIEEFNNYLETLKGNWTMTSLGRVATSQIYTRRFVLTNRDKRFKGGSDQGWTDIVNAIKDLDARPGVAVQNLIIASRQNNARWFGEVSVTFAVATRDGSPSNPTRSAVATPAANPATPPPVAATTAPVEQTPLPAARPNTSASPLQSALAER